MTSPLATPPHINPSSARAAPGEKRRDTTYLAVPPASQQTCGCGLPTNGVLHPQGQLGFPFFRVGPPPRSPSMEKYFPGRYVHTPALPKSDYRTQSPNNFPKCASGPGAQQGASPHCPCFQEGGWAAADTAPLAGWLVGENTPATKQPVWTASTPLREIKARVEVRQRVRSEERGPLPPSAIPVSLAV